LETLKEKIDGFDLGVYSEIIGGYTTGHSSVMRVIEDCG